MSFADKKVISIGTVSKLSGLSIRQIRYYEERKLIFPERTEGGTRMYSFRDIERLVEISLQMEDGLHTYDIHRIEKKRKLRMDSSQPLATGHPGLIARRNTLLGGGFSGLVSLLLTQHF